jgi:glycosyltransferase involved in cell wall biosynthesis
MPAELVSVMMPAYNAGKYISQAVNSLLAQTSPDWELVVIDDGSTDDTAHVLARYSDPRIRVYHQANAGEAAARNAALDRVRGKYLAFLDADDIFLPEHIETAAAFLQAHPEYAGLYTDGYYINQDGQRLKPLSARRRGPFEGDIFEQVMRSSDVFGAPVCVFLTHKVIIQANLRFDPEIIIGPDWDFLTQYAQVGRFGYSPKTTCFYRVHSTNISLRTNIEKRTRSLARCREKAIHMARFGECSQEARFYVFYDLLINLLGENQERRREIIQWPEFLALPPVFQAQLVRHMAVNLLVGGQDYALAGDWLRLSKKLDSRDIRTLFLSGVYRLSPRLCETLLRLRKGGREEKGQISPFADLFQP